MINSLRVANEFVSLLPTDEVPECTDGYQIVHQYILYPFLGKALGQQQTISGGNLNQPSLQRITPSTRHPLPLVVPA